MKFNRSCWESQMKATWNPESVVDLRSSTSVGSLKVNWNLRSDYIQESISSKISVSKNPFPLCPSSPLLHGCCRCVSRRAEMRRKWKVDVSIFLFYLELYNVDKAVSSRSLSFPSVSLNISSVLNNNNDLTLKRKNIFLTFCLKNITHIFLLFPNLTKMRMNANEY